jgi:acyl-CoA reductase-like NAD-dependent aldehyde dehydrogenase
VAELFIAGAEVKAARLDRVEIRNPASQAVVGDAPAAGPAQVDQAVDAAAQAFRAWRAVPAAQRGEVLATASAAVSAQTGQLAPLLTAEQGKPLHESRMEIARFCRTLEHYASLAAHLRGESVHDLESAVTALVLAQPLGVVAAIVRWNFPVTLLGKKLGPALIAGNTVIAKPAESTPLTTLAIARIMHAAGLPDGVLNVLTGPGDVAGAALVAHPGVAKVAFAGSSAAGRAVMAAAAGRCARVTAELDSCDPLIICADADVAKAVSAASWARFFNCGQSGLAIKRVFVHERRYDEVVTRLAQKANGLVLGAGDAPGTQVGPMHSRSARDRIVAQLSAAVAAGGEVVAGGGVPQAEGFAAGWFHQPTVVINAGPGSAVADQDTFGPLLPVWPVADLDEAVHRANATPFGMAASVWTRDLAAARYAMNELDTGYVWVNSPTRVYDELPFGGTKLSGYGKEHGTEAIAFYQETKTVVLHD